MVSDHRGVPIYRDEWQINLQNDEETAAQIRNKLQSVEAQEARKKPKKVEKSDGTVKAEVAALTKTLQKAEEKAKNVKKALKDAKDREELAIAVIQSSNRGD